jgi:glycosyltransferase involved in cell wall biosynthesis
LLDERYLAKAPAWRQPLYRKLPINIAQVLEAYRVRNQYDAIISWAENLGLPFAALLKATFSHTPHIAIWSWISKKKKADVLRRVHSHVDKIILMSSSQRDFALHFLHLPPSKVVASRWPVDTNFWRPINTPSDMLCSVGREMRDYGTLVKAIRDLNIPCHIAAGGSMNIVKKDQWIKDLEEGGPLPPHITIGRKGFSELRQLYARSRFLVMPILETETDNGSTSILEAMAMGKPVICSRTEGQRDIIEEGKTGMFVPVGDAKSLREAILFLWNHPEETQRMGREARRFVEENHALEIFIGTVKRAVEEAVEAHRIS